MTILAASLFDTIGRPGDWVLVNLERVFHGFGPTRVIGAFGLAIIATTVLIRAGLFPIFSWQLRTMARTQAEQRTIAPQLKELRQKYRKEPQKLSQEMQKLYKEHGINPFNGCLGCLPLLVQLPVIIALYNGIRLATGNLHSDRGFLWVSDLSKSLQDACCRDQGLGGLLTHPQLVILPAIAVVATYIQAKMMTPPVHGDMSEAEQKQAELSRVMILVSPAFVAFFIYSFYQGLTLYWLTQTIFMVAQQWYVRGWGSVRVPAWMPGAGRITPLSFPGALPGASPAPPRAARSGRNGRAAPAPKPKQTARAERGSGDGAGPAAPRPARPAASGARSRPNRGGKRRRRR